MNNIELNINNLTELWKIAGRTFQNFTTNESFSYAHVKGTEWPNRIWTNKGLSKDSVKAIVTRMRDENNLTFSTFNTTSVQNHELTKGVFELKSIQYGMSLNLNQKFETDRKIEFKDVTLNNASGLWSKTFYEAFNYNISTETVDKTTQSINYDLIYHNEKLLGTIAFFTTNQVTGIHSLGILPSMRKKGYATEIMHHAINRIIDDKKNLVTLQASETAKGLYEKLGFSHDFIMENYELNK